MRYQLWLRGEEWLKNTTAGEWILIEKHADLFDAVYGAAHYVGVGYAAWRIECVPGDYDRERV
jgi:hypothetical protein